MNTNIDSAKEKDKHYYNLKQKQGFKAFDFKVGMDVMKRNTKKIGRKSDRLQPDWFPGYEIISITGQKALIKNTKTGELLKPIHLTHLKPFIKPSLSHSTVSVTPKSTTSDITPATSKTTISELEPSSSYVNISNSAIFLNAKAPESAPVAKKPELTPVTKTPQYSPCPLCRQSLN